MAKSGWTPAMDSASRQRGLSLLTRRLSMAPPGSVYLGTQTRQMLSLLGTEYGIGVQRFDEYFRSAAYFCWYKGGVHNDNFLDPGGGTELMRLDSGGNLNILGAFGSLSDR